MADIFSEDSFKLAKKLQNAVKGEESSPAQNNDFRFCFSKVFEDIPSVQNWCRNLGQALETEVEFISGGKPNPPIEGADFQINIRLSDDEISLSDILDMDSFAEFETRTRNYNNQNIIYIADSHTVMESIGDFQEDWATKQVTVENNGPVEMTYTQRKEKLDQIHQNMKVSLSSLEGEQKIDAEKLYDEFHSIVVGVVIQSITNDTISLTSDEAIDLHELGHKLRESVGDKSNMFENSFIGYAMVLNGWDSTKQGVHQADKIINDDLVTEDLIPEIE